MKFLERLALSACFTLTLGFSSEPGAAHTSRWCATCERSANGRIKRSSTARRHFRAEHPCPSTGLTTGPCPGYVIDHIQALRHGGADDPRNMAWQTKEQAREKDRVE